MTEQDDLELRRVPTTAELRDMLQKYFVGSITDAGVATLAAYVESVLRDPPLLAGEISKFDPSKGGRGYGLAWREQLAYDRRFPRSIDLAAWLASSTDGYPAARPYCPDLYVGKWSQLEPDSSPLATWELHLDGTLVTTDSRFRKRERWCVHRQGAGPVGDALWLDDALEISHKILLVRAVSPSELRFEPVGTGTIHRLERVS